MDSTNAIARNASRIRTSRTHALGAESLEGRQLLSTTAGATAPTAAPAAQAVTTTPTDGMATPGNGYNFGGGRGFGRMEMRSRFGGGAGYSPTSSLSGGASGSQTSISAAAVGTGSNNPMAGYDTGTGGFSFSGRGNRGYAGSMMAGGGSGFGGMAGGSGLSLGGSGLGDGEYGSVLKAGSSAAPTTTTTLTPQERFAAIEQLRTDQQAIHDRSDVTPALKAAVRNDLTAVRKDVTATPDLAKLQALQTDLQAVSGTLPTASQLTQIQSDYAAVLASEGVTDAAVINQAFADAQKVVAATNVTADDLTKIAADQTAAGLPSGMGGDRVTRSIDLGSLLGVGSLGRRPIRFNAPMTPTAVAPVAATPTTTAAASATAAPMSVSATTTATS